MKTILRTIALVCLLIMFGIIGGVETGGSLSNLLWSIPIGAVALVSSMMAGQGV